jgi:alpha-L-fucosidase
MRYEPTLESLARHPVPAWFHDAKFGIFIHWGVFAIPAWAPPNKMGIAEVDFTDPESVARLFQHSPYSEWYLNSLRIGGSPVQRHHAETYGADYPYEAFAPQFRAAARGSNLEAWSDLCLRAGARYVVMVTKHHDGFLLWPSRHANPHRSGWQSDRDFVGELTQAVRARGLRMGLYYSGGIDWTFHGLPIDGIERFLSAIPQSADYAAYADAHWRELIERYAPAVLWNDIGYPETAQPARLFADYYNCHPDGVINDRFKLGAGPGGEHHDFITPEYMVLDRIWDDKWEATRGIGGSFGFNRAEPEDHLLTAEQIIHLLVDVVSKNGNLLLNVGPTADGLIPWPQAARLLAVGWWLRTHADAIYGTRPWARHAGRTADGREIRFTCKGDALYAIVLETPRTTEVVLQDLHLGAGATVHLLGYDEPLRWEQTGHDVAVRLPHPLARGPACAFRFSGLRIASPAAQ